MTLETKASLDKETIETLQDLIQVNIDSAKGFNESGKMIKDVNLANLFSEMAKTRNELAEDLKSHVEYTGERPREEGTFLATLHRTWLDIRGKISGGDAVAILVEAEKGEDYIKAAYEDALKKAAGSAVNDVLTRQYAVVKSGHDRVRDLRDAYKAK